MLACDTSDFEETHAETTLSFVSIVPKFLATLQLI